jgi:hypothetical protein
VSSAERSPEVIAAEIAQTRDRLAGTIDELVYRAQPKTIVNRQLELLRESLLLKEDGSVDPMKVGRLVGGVVGFLAIIVLIRRVVG